VTFEKERTVWVRKRVDARRAESSSKKEKIGEQRKRFGFGDSALGKGFKSTR